ncbi:hypothetical protein [Peribacillus sp. SCS-155]|uniref:hypothetical protein n=1 Tax=Peribacillus sedimenti TaxID=3115297 RepID=UPI0039066B62
MNFSIYFDESNKLDETKLYSYYGGFGGSESDIGRLSKAIKAYYKNSSSELHFAEYTKDTAVSKYFNVINTVLNSGITFNLFIVNNDSALQLANHYGITDTELRNMLYIKIPERLFYGITRYNTDITKVNITVDRDDNYKKIRLYSKIKEQMNAHSAYRNLRYQINKVKSVNSAKNKYVQIIDVIMGMTVFIMEKSYNADSVGAKVKSDLIYRLLLEGDNVNLFRSKVRIFKWDGDGENIIEVNIGDYIPEFLLQKQSFDLQEIMRLQKIKDLHGSQSPLSLGEYQKLMGYSGSLRRMLLGYLDVIHAKDRNHSLRINTISV